jgi:hypothetical protein
MALIITADARLDRIGAQIAANLAKIREQLGLPPAKAAKALNARPAPVLSLHRHANRADADARRDRRP